MKIHIIGAGGVGGYCGGLWARGGSDNCFVCRSGKWRHCVHMG